MSTHVPDPLTVDYGADDSQVPLTPQRIRRHVPLVGLLVAAVTLPALAAVPRNATRQAAPGPDFGLTDTDKEIHATGAGGMRIHSAELPKSIAESRRILRRARAKAAVDSYQYKDTTYVLRLADRYLRSGVPVGRRRTVARTLRVNAWWYARRAAPTPKQRGLTLREEDGVLSSYWEGRGFAVNPVGTTGRWFGLNKDISAVGLAEALLPLGVARNDRGRHYLIWEYYDVPDRPGVITPGASGMAQGRVAQVMSIAYSQTGDQRFADAARGALQSFQVPVNRGGVLSMVRYPAKVKPRTWYVERAYPGSDPWRGAALNGFMVSVLNLNASANLLRKQSAAGTYAEGALDTARLARGLADRGRDTLKFYLPLHDTGSWSYYGMLTPGHSFRTHRASLNYHCYHVRLLRGLENVMPGNTFGTYAVRWDRYVSRAGKTCPT